MMEAIHASKNLLRKEIKQKIASLTAESKKQQTDVVLKKLFALPIFTESRRISVFLSTNDEVSTEPILQKIFESNKQCFVPRYSAKHMEMVRLESMKDFHALPLTKWNIKQPDLSDQRENAMETGGLDLIIVPGVAFTASGVRLGHGRGYYDTFLAGCIAQQELPPRTVAIAFREQLVPQVPAHDHDIHIDVVLHPDYTHQEDNIRH